jgi:multicomponent Na+:H+ antiporter subunit G
MIDWLGHGLIILGGALLAIAAFGLFALEDAMARQHAATKAGTLALSTTCLGVMLVAGDVLWILRVAAIMAFLLMTMPLASHMLARAALQESGAEPGPAQAPLVREDTKAPKR